MSATLTDNRNIGLKFSGILHGVLLLIALFGLPEFFRSKNEWEPSAITVEILPISTQTNVKPSEKLPEPKKETPKEEVKTSIKPTPQAAPTPKKEEAVPTPKEVKKEEKKKEEAKKTEEKKKKEDDLAAVLNAVAATAKTQQAEKKTEKASADTQSQSTNYNPTLPMTMSEKDAIRSQFAKCWNVPAGARDAQNLIVVLRVKLQQDGSVTEVTLAQDSSRYAADPFFRAAADSAQRAVWMCSPLKNLDQTKYGTWGDMELTFDPKDMLM